MLKYLFTAHYCDGMSIVQNQHDRSMQRDDKNAFYDVKYAPFQPLDTLSSFELRGSGHTYSVSLETGEFRVDGSVVIPGDALGRRELVYFRRNMICPQAPGIPETTVYHLGWKLSELQKVMQIW